MFYGSALQSNFHPCLLLFCCLRTSSPLFTLSFLSLSLNLTEPCSRIFWSECVKLCICVCPTSLQACWDVRRINMIVDLSSLLWRCGRLLAVDFWRSWPARLNAEADDAGSRHELKLKTADQLALRALTLIVAFNRRKTSESHEKSITNIFVIRKSTLVKSNGLADILQ